KDATQFIADIRAKVHDFLPGSGTTAQVRQALFSALGPGGLDLLADRDGNHVIDAADVGVTDNSPNEIRFDLHLNKALTVVHVPIDFDIGGDGLGLKVEQPAQVVVQVGFDFQMGFGISRTDGFFFDTSAGDVPGKPDPELTVNVQASIPDLRASGQLGFLQLDLNDEDADNDPNNPGVDVNGNGVKPTSVNLTFTVNVKDPVGSNNHLTFQDLSSPGLNLGDVLAAALTGVADVNLNGRASFGGSAVFPSILTDFHLGWTFANVDTASNTFDFGSKPDVEFKNIKLDLGSFFSKFITPVLGEVKDALRPLEPILD